MLILVFLDYLKTCEFFIIWKIKKHKKKYVAMLPGLLLSTLTMLIILLLNINNYH